MIMALVASYGVMYFTISNRGVACDGILSL